MMHPNRGEAMEPYPYIEAIDFHGYSHYSIWNAPIRHWRLDRALFVDAGPRLVEQSSDCENL